mmetsp:Transcript_50919/g.110457  ORF Transcript_50919/g.110457 Transcript_50919/m.110457 type:complete len:91 (+) Transcript_50919:99-371(+)
MVFLQRLLKSPLLSIGTAGAQFSNSASSRQRRRLEAEVVQMAQAPGPKVYAKDLCFWVGSPTAQPPRAPLKGLPAAHLAAAGAKDLLKRS